MINKICYIGYCFFIFLLFQSTLYARENGSGVLKGRISRFTRSSSLIRLRIDSKNVKFINKNDKVEIGHSMSEEQRCIGFVMGKSNEYILIKMVNILECLRHTNIVVGLYIHLFSKDLENNIQVASELAEILVKKRLALKTKLDREKKEMEQYLAKVSSINERYEALRAKIELEWREELGNVQEDKANLLKMFKDTEMQLGELDFKLEQYKIHDLNSEYDRWALDPRLYYQK